MEVGVFDRQHANGRNASEAIVMMVVKDRPSHFGIEVVTVSLMRLWDNSLPDAANKARLYDFLDEIRESDPAEISADNCTSVVVRFYTRTITVPSSLKVTTVTNLNEAVCKPVCGVAIVCPVLKFWIPCILNQSDLLLVRKGAWEAIPPSAAR